MRTPRSMTFGSYNAHADGRWTLTSWELSPPKYQTKMIELPGCSEPLDLSTALTDGEPVYSGRTLTALFESSEGSRLVREARISRMMNSLDGYRMNIILPDDSEHYLTGRLSVSRLYNDNAHGSVRVDAVCNPWLYAMQETVIDLQAKAQVQEAILINQGRLSVVPVVEVRDGDVQLTYGDHEWSLSEGIYSLADLYLRHGQHHITYSGNAPIRITYREAIL